MKIKIARDEWYPVYVIEMSFYNSGHLVDIDDKFFTKYLSVSKAFHDMQDELRKLYGDES